MPDRQDPPTGAAGGFRRDIQGLRALAVLLVVLYHAGLPGLTGGYVGVDVFFVISGFLITSHLVTSLRATGRVGFADFYARRLRRLLPASLAVVVLTVVASLIFLPPLRFAPVLRDAAATVLYVPNFHFYREGLDYLADTEPTPFLHYWSLGVEEQFYLVWPILLAGLFLLVRRARQPGRWFAVGLGLVTAASLAACIVYTATEPTLAFYASPLRAWEFGVGGLVALLVGTGLLRQTPPMVLTAGSFLGLVAVLVAGFGYDDGTPFPGSAAISPVIATALVIACGSGRSPGVAQQLLGTRPMFRLGTLSYSIYLVHWPLLIIVQASLGARHQLPLWATLALAAATVPIAELIHRFVEEPGRRARFLTRRTPWLTLGIASVTAVVLVVSFLVVDRRTDTITLDAGEAVPVMTGPATVYGPVDVRPTLQGTAFVPSNLTPSLRDAGNDIPILYRNGCHLDGARDQVQDCAVGSVGPQVALFGDSHAAQWYPPLSDLAEGGEFRLSSYTKSSCSPALIPAVVNGRVDPSCARWREAVVRHLEAAPPDLIVVAGRLPVVKGGQDRAEVLAEWTAGLSATIGRLAAVTTVLVITDNPTLPEVPAVCLAAHLEDAHACDSPASVVDLDALAAGVAAVERSGARVADLNAYICDLSNCPAIIGNVLVYRDNHHLTQAFTRTLTGPLRTAVRAALRE